MSRVVHLVIGPDEHGVVRHGLLVAEACGDRVVRVRDVDSIPDLPPCDVVHLPFTDRLLARTADTAAIAFERIAALVARHGAALSVTLHDVPHDDSALQQRRRALYRAVLLAARGVVVNSRTELALVEGDAENVHSLRMIALPIEELPPSEAACALPPRSVAVLGFVYPDRGHDQVIAALPSDCLLAAIGRASEGHEDLIARYQDMASGRWLLTGFVNDAQLRSYLDAAAVPVAPNRRVTASGSINTWLASGRRPLVPDSTYARELADDRPGAIILYDADDPRALRQLIDRAIADPSLTRLADDVVRGPSTQSVASAYTKHLAACVPPRAHVVDGSVVVPDNRWDLIPTDKPTDAPRPQPTISVVIPYFDAQHTLDLLLTALAVQTYPLELIEIVVVDDGSPIAPDVSAAGGVEIRVLRQPDAGFRAARARNLGAHAATGQVLVFVDGDTVPEPGYLDALVRLPARCPDVLAVGRRRHADLSEVQTHDVHAWREGTVDLAELPEPAWLRDAYAATDNLVHGGRRAYRYVLSAVIAMTARLFRDVGGFDERFTGYGGEDWELAHRARNAGAVLAHVPAAIAWHDGPDWALRGDADSRRATKNVETATLAALLPDPQSRGGGQWSPYPSIVVQCASMSDTDAMATVRSAFAAGVDCAFWFNEITGAQLARDAVGAHVGQPPADVLARAWCHVQLHEPADLRDLDVLADLAERHGEVRTRSARLRSTRAVARARRWAGDDVDAFTARMFGRHDRAGLAPRRDLDLAAALAASLDQSWATRRS